MSDAAMAGGPATEPRSARLERAEVEREHEQLLRAERIVIGLRWLAVLSWPVLFAVTEIPWRPEQVWPVYAAIFVYAAVTHLWIRHFAMPIRTVSVMTTVGDSMAIAAMCSVSGGIYSEVYPVFYLGLLATSVRFGMKETFAVLGLNGALSVALFMMRPGAAADLGVRLFYLAFIGLLGALLSREVRRYYTRALKEGEKASLLLSVNREITATLDLGELLARILQEAIQVLPCAGAVVVLLDRGGNDVERIVTKGGLAAPGIDEVRVSLRSGILGEARVQGPLVLNDPAEARRRLESEAVRQFLSRNLAVIPVRRRETLGFLVLVDRRGGEPFGEEETSLLGAVADQAAVAIENARLVEDVRAARDRHRDLLWRTIHAGEEERRRLAGEIHDSVGAQLFELYYAIRQSRDRVGDDAPGIARELESLEDRARAFSQNLRRVMNDLRPTVLDDLGFVEALREHVSALQGQGGLAVRLQVDESVRELPAEVGTMLFRVLQEAVLNVRKHAGAKTAEIELHRENGGLALSIRDDGRGFDPSRPVTGHYGLLSMRERAEACGGELVIESRPGKGTEVRVRVPRETLALGGA